MVLQVHSLQSKRACFHFIVNGLENSVIALPNLNSESLGKMASRPRRITVKTTQTGPCYKNFKPLCVECWYHVSGSNVHKRKTESVTVKKTKKKDKTDNHVPNKMCNED